MLRVADASSGGYITVEAGAKIAAGSTTGATILQLNGDGSPAVFQLNNNGSQTASNAGVLRLNGAAPTGSVLLGDNNTFSIGKLIVANGGALTIGKAAGAVTGGVVAITGSVPGSIGTQTSTIGTGSVNVQDATLLVNAPITGSGTVSVGLAGTIGGSSTIASPVTANSGGTIAPGGLAGSGLELAALGTGHLTLGAGRAQGARASRPRPNPRSANFDAHRPGRMARCAVWRSGAGRPLSLTQRAIKTPSFQQPDCEVCMIFALRPGAVNGLDMGTES